ncbi:hypothetical protein JCM17843_17270 [Kordiimonadales bacterium JCM 17843]|nr:hypothetical protein JCM17843_17270 [Kordiimonadales bacterium JCM 17843]
MVLDAWLTPPDYTGKSPIVLHGPMAATKGHDEAAAPLSAPVGSMLVVRLNGGRQAPVLLAGEDEIPFDTVGTVDHRLEFALSDPDLSMLEIRQGGRSRALWPLALVPDQPPSISFAATPTQSRRQAMRLTYVVNDDYGVTDASLTLVPLPEGAQASGTPGDDRLEIALRGAQTRGEAASLVVYEDLTAHPFAGRLVTAVLSATDAAGQTGKSDALVFRLPERVFSHPVAKELVAIRKDMLVSPARASKETDRIDRVSRDLDAYDGDLTVFAALRSAYWRMNSDSSRKAVAEVGEILWETALRLEDGQMSLATRSLRDALDQFEEALEGGEDSLDQATAALEAMMQQFLSQMARQQSETAPMRTDGTQRMQVVGSDMLQQMIRQMRDLAAAGEMDAAKAMLDQLRDIMENASANSMTAEDYERMMAASRAAEALEGLSEDQRTLLNQTSRQTLVNRLREKNGQPQGGFDSLGVQQQGLGQRLNDILQGLGDGGMEAPGGLEQAMQAMEDAGRALSEQSGPGAIRGQAEAVRALDEAKGALEQMLEQAMQQMPSGNGLDPLGRPQPGMNTRGFELPDILDARQVERILEELRQRISNPDLSDEERQYLRRLLRRF